ncbi:hypothetical protein DNU06_08255 [Putridiphycobacter roseus]|uniref:Glycoside-hydrolase family GH114 TIM-barrel domain-containing protein n=1 Tax=Putridiphycobacter roseus TaxID=2219161 RepID=A0A2W1NGY3_9FLAO|nr:endo alpha-1,4 polygalactosaminidase [Putridiphycobacter roseus]PZE17256.1 hypothetical protein DNU06_08255 [Putridiphycobacter roseus]
MDNFFVKISGINGLLFGLLFFCFACNKKEVPSLNYADEMRSFVINLSNYAKDKTPGFMVIPQNGIPLLAIEESVSLGIAAAYINAIDGQGQEDLFYGYEKDDKLSPLESTNEKITYLDLAVANGVTILSTDYCSTEANMVDAYAKNSAKGYVSFAATERELNNIPTQDINHENNGAIADLSMAKNFLYLINPSGFESKKSFVDALDATNYDAFILDLFFNEEVLLTKEEVVRLQTKPNGAKRLVIAYMSIGEAEDYRFYWHEEWQKKKNAPTWLYEENKQWKGNYKVFYWEKAWQNIIFGDENGYLDKVLSAGFDGTYLDIIDAYEFFESKTE